MASDISLPLLLLTAAASVFSAIALWSPHCRWPAGIGAGMVTLLGAAVFFGAIGYENPLDGGRHRWAMHPVTFGASLSRRAMPAPLSQGSREHLVMENR